LTSGDIQNVQLSSHIYIKYVIKQKLKRATNKSENTSLNMKVFNLRF